MTTFQKRLIPMLITLQAEHASYRQNVKRGYILVWKSDRYEQVTSWYIYETKKLAHDIISLVIMLAAVKAVTPPEVF